ncbi:hypothetical protein HA050_03960 [Iodobacter sp. HSC-16F04]|uniref:Uncharacterized protein n=1 Tax=Iodobacter violaceini TaxID=3044271 RepID=A0ABX0KLX6_9NEIS|nr:hypothetical protein [Iodobacter violacea]NHQ85265.1 hypothetical protein [Iodobacter violacea]
MKIAADSIQTLLQPLNARPRSEKNEGSQAQESSFSFKIPKWDPVSSRKSAAKARLDMLKRQLDGMLKFAGVGKSNVAAAARLAKQIAAAVAEYAGVSGGSAVQTPLISGGSPAAAAPQTAPAAGSTENAGAAAGQAAEQALQIAEKAEKAEATEKTEKEEKAEKSNNEMASPSNKGMSAEDKAFLEDAKKIMQKAKLLLALEIQKSKRESKTDKSLYQDAIKTMDTSLQKATAALEQAAKAANAPMIYSASGNTTAIQVSMPQFSAQA